MVFRNSKNLEKKPAPILKDHSIKVLLAEDHAVVREGLKVLLETESDIQVIGEAENGRQAVRLAEKLDPDIIVMDIAMPFLNGLEAARQIRDKAPRTKIIVLSAYNDDAYVEQMISNGARGYLLKQTSFLHISKGIRQVHLGNYFFSPTIENLYRNHTWKTVDFKGRKSSLRPLLSSREAEVLQLIAEGNANKKIASELSISIKTVEKHRQHLMEKLNIHDTAGLTRYSIAAGVIESSIHLNTQ